MARQDTPAAVHAVHTAHVMHKKCSVSCLSRRSERKVGFHGLLNLAFLVLVLVNFRLIVANWLKYGFLLDPRAFVGDDPVPVSAVALHGALLALFWVMLVTEQAASKGRVSAPAARVVTRSCVALVVAVPTVALFYMGLHPLAGLTTMMWACVMCLKMWSYALVNEELRLLQAAAKKGDAVVPDDDDDDDADADADADDTDPADQPKDGAAGKSDPGSDSESEDPDSATPAPPARAEGEPVVAYPQNLTVGNVAYFLAAPTLVYELNYPRTARVRPFVVVRNAGMFLVILALQMVIVQQYMVPTIEGAVTPMADLDVPRLMERLLVLAIPNLYVWLLGFYAFFHLYLNMVAELLRFGDRAFYLDWWQSTHVDRFWRTWNLPVHNWLLKHLWFPAMERGASKLWMSMWIFLFSAVFHELLVSPPIGAFKGWAFAGMMAQVPFSLMTKPLQGTMAGNLVFWLSIMLGQPLAVLAIALDYYERNNL